MPGHPISDDLRVRIVAHYKEVTGATYASTAALFSIGEATVSRLLRLERERGSVQHVPKPLPPRSRIDREWLRRRVESFPDARLKDHALAHEQELGIRVSVTGLWFALAAMGITHKKNSFRRRA